MLIMAVLTLTAAQRQDIEQRRHRTDRKRVADRLAALLWLADGETEKEVGRRLDVDRKTVGEWVQIFRSHGIDGLCTLNYQGDPGELSVEQIAEFKAEAAKGTFRSAKQIAAWIQEHFQVSYSESGVKALMHRIGVSYHKSSGFLWKADRAAQEQFVQQFEADAPLLEKAKTSGAISSMAATRFGALNACFPPGCSSANA
jgi:transposase